MRDLVFVAFIGAFLLLGFKRPFLFVLAYAYVDIVSPQRLSYYMLNSIPLSLIVAALAVLGWFVADDKRHFKFVPRQFLILVLLVYAGVTTIYADFPLDALVKWEWAWKSMIWAVFLPLTLTTRLRIEAYLLIMTLCASAIIIVGGLKTVAAGGGYGVLNLMVTSNSGLYESSTISTVAIALIPIILWLAKHGTIYPPDWRVKIFAYCLIFACLLMPVGTVARTGLVCIAVLAVLMLRDVKRRIVYLGLIGFLGLAAIPFLPSTFTARMETIQGYQADSSATTRIAVWKWTWDYAKENPLGGGFDAYRQNKLTVATKSTQDLGQVEVIAAQTHKDEARAYHSSYFEMLGEQGFPGLILFLLIHGIGLIRMGIIRRRHFGAEGGKAWISPLATALQSAQIIYLIGSLFIGIAYQPFIYMLIGVQMGFDTYVGRKDKAEKKRPFLTRKPPLQPAGLAKA